MWIYLTFIVAVLALVAGVGPVAWAIVTDARRRPAQQGAVVETLRRAYGESARRAA